VPVTSNALFPSTPYHGLGVRLTSTAAPWLNHQNSLAEVNVRSRSIARRLAVSYSGSAWISRLHCCQNLTSLVSWNSQPFATTPCWLGNSPVSSVAWAVQVTAGSTSGMSATQPDWARADSRGACVSSRGVRPTAFSRTTGGMGDVVRAVLEPRPTGSG
jgi:hypothetical protein